MPTRNIVGQVYDLAVKLEVGALESTVVVEAGAEVLETVLRESQVVGPRVHDARIAALCLQHGITELWTADRDFSRFPALRTRNPCVS